MARVAAVTGLGRTVVEVTLGTPTCGLGHGEHRGGRQPPSRWDFW